MENIIEFHCWGQCNSIGYWPNPFKNIERPTKSRCQLGTGSNPQGALLGVHTQVHLFPNLKLLEQPVLICIYFMYVLCCLQILIYYLYFLFHFYQCVCSNQHHVNWITPTDGSITTFPIQCLKWTHPKILLIPIFIIKLNQWKVLLPFLLLVHHVHPQHILNISSKILLILSVCPSICG